MRANWQNDPMLLDSEPLQAKDWVTANTLLALNGLDDGSVFRKHDFSSNKEKWLVRGKDDTWVLNLYSVLVRKSDFVREKKSDRILARFPFIVLNAEEVIVIHKNILTFTEHVREYFYKAINSTMTSWKTRVETYLQRGAIPYPLYRCAFEIFPESTATAEKKVQAFESARGKRYTIPIEITPILSYLCGVINGDGHLHPHWLRVVDETKEHIEFISQLFTKQFNDPGEVFKQGNAWNVELRSSSAVRLFHFLTDHTIQGAKYASLREPLLFQRLGNPFRSHYWRGVMDADGTYKNHITFSSASLSYIEDFSAYLLSKGIITKIRSMSNGAYSLSIPIDYKIHFAREIGALHPKKRADFTHLLQKKPLLFHGLNHLHLTELGYFDFRKLSSLCIIGLGSYLKYFRGTKSYSELEGELAITRNQYSYYEQERRAVPFSLFLQLAHLTTPHQHFMEVLESFNDQLYYQTSNAQPIKLPLKPTEKVIFVMSHLLPLSSWTRIIQSSRELDILLNEVFGIPSNNKKIIRGNLLKHFLQTFGIYQNMDVTTILTSTLE